MEQSGDRASRFRVAIGIVLLALVAPFHQAISADGLPAGCSAVENAGDTAGVDTVKMYPSLTPRTYIRAGFAATAQMAADRKDIVFAPSRPDTWVFVRDKDGVQLHPARVDVNVRSFVAHLFLPPNEPVPATYTLYVKIERAGYSVCRRYADDSKIKVVERDPFTLKLDPALAPAASRPKDSTKDKNDTFPAGRLGITFDYPSLIDNPFARLFFHLDTVLSTDSKDKQTKLEPRFGIERSLLSSWYVPVRLDTKYSGNQSGANQSLVTSLGAQTILPWGWTRDVLWNSVIKAPISPTLEISPQWEHTVESDTTKLRNHFRLAGDFHWNPIFLQLLTSLLSKGDTAKEEPTADQIVLDVRTKFWWMPDERDTKNLRSELEYRLELGLIIPFSTLSSVISPEFLSGLTKKEQKANGSARAVLKYTSGANEANGFRRSDEFTFNIEYVK